MTLIGEEETLSADTPTTLNLATAIRFVNTTGGNALLTLKKEDGTVIGSTTILSDGTFFLNKRAQETVEVDTADVKATKVVSAGL